MFQKDESDQDDIVEFKQNGKHIEPSNIDVMRSKDSGVVLKQQKNNYQSSSRSRSRSSKGNVRNTNHVVPRRKNHKLAKIDVANQPLRIEIDENPDDIVDEKDDVNMPTSPRSAFIKKKFKLEEKGEVVLENYCCAARMNILLQGMLYVTERAVYFYSPFNNKTIFGHGTKIKIPYEAVKLLKKESTLLIFPNAIRFVLNSREEIVFASFVSRDTCYSLILRQFSIAGHSEAAIQSLQDKSTKKSRAVEAKKHEGMGRNPLLFGPSKDTFDARLKMMSSSQRMTANNVPDQQFQQRKRSKSRESSQNIPRSSKSNPFHYQDNSQPPNIFVEESKLAQAKPAVQTTTTTQQQYRSSSGNNQQLNQIRYDAIGLRPDQFITVGEDYMEVSRTDEELNNEPFDSKVDKSVIESDYSDEGEDVDCLPGHPNNIKTNSAKVNSNRKGDSNRRGGDREQADLSQQQRHHQSKNSRGFMKGCYVPRDIENDLEYQEVIARRMNAIKEDIREFEKWDWEDVYEQSYPGVPLKHFLDNWVRHGQIDHLDEDCPVGSHTSFMNDYIGQRNNNRIEKFVPVQCPAFPSQWTQWHDAFDTEQLQSMPMKTFFQIDVTNFAVDPVPMQPKTTQNMLNYSTYLVSPNKAIVFKRSEGREFIFADRFAVEFYYEITQTVNPAIEKERDPKRALQMFTTHLKVKGRIHIIKSLALLKSKFVSEAQKQVRKMFTEPIQGLQEHLQSTLHQRLQHFLEPGHQNLLNREHSEYSNEEDSQYSSDDSGDQAQQQLQLVEQQKQAQIRQEAADAEKKLKDEHIRNLQEQVTFQRRLLAAMLIFVALAVCYEPIVSTFYALSQLHVLDYLPSVQVNAPRQSLFNDVEDLASQDHHSGHQQDVDDSEVAYSDLPSLPAASDEF